MKGTNNKAAHVNISGLPHLFDQNITFTTLFSKPSHIYSLFRVKILNLTIIQNNGYKGR